MCHPGLPRGVFAPIPTRGYLPYLGQRQSQHRLEATDSSASCTPGQWCDFSMSHPLGGLQFKTHMLLSNSKWVTSCTRWSHSALICESLGKHYSNTSNCQDEICCVRILEFVAVIQNIFGVQIWRAVNNYVCIYMHPDRPEQYFFHSR